MAQKNVLLASKRLNKILSAVNNSLFSLEILWCRTVYDDIDIPNTALHSHSFFELHLCLSSHNDFKVDNNTITLNKGEFLLLSPKTKHIVCPYEKNYSELVAAFDFTDTSAIKDYFDNDCAEFYTGKATVSMQQAVADMLNHAMEEKYGYNEYILSCASCFFIDLFALIAKKIDNSAAVIYEKDNDDRIKIAKKYIEDNIDKRIFAEDIANQVNVSTRHLNRLVKSAENTSVAELIRRTRIKRAKKLLMKTQMSLSEIAEATGFGSSFHFSNTFKSFEGVTPGAYRKDINK